MKPLSVLNTMNQIYPLKKVPDILFYKAVQSNQRFSYDIFNMFSPKTNSKLGMLVCHKTNLALRENYNGPILIIDFITAKIPNKGYGSILLNFAKKYSKKIGCNGYITLKADSSFTPNRIPHLFYRKHNFSTLDILTDKKMDKFIRKNKDATHKNFKATIMHYPPEPEKPKTFKNMFLKFLNILNH